MNSNMGLVNMKSMMVCLLVLSMMVLNHGVTAARQTNHIGGFGTLETYPPPVPNEPNCDRRNRNYEYCRCNKHQYSCERRNRNYNYDCCHKVSQYSIEPTAA